jgi:hypothetical protein
MTDHHAALVHTMMLATAANRQITDMEMRIVGDIVNHLPVFADYDRKHLSRDLEAGAALLATENGLERVLEAIRAALPPKLRETAYALACDVVAADGDATQEELQLLELLRDRLTLDPLVAAGIERGARARFRRA